MRSKILFLLLGATIILLLIGIFIIYSSGISLVTDTSSRSLFLHEYSRQILWSVFGFILLIFVALNDYRRLEQLSIYAYLGVLILMIITLIAGHTVNGAKSWLGIGSLGIQPSEFAKISTIIMLAHFMNRIRSEIHKMNYLLLSLLIVLIPMLLIIVQPDLGTATVFYPIFIIMIYVAGMPIRYVIFLIFSAILIALFAVTPVLIENIHDVHPSFSLLFSTPRLLWFSISSSAIIFLIALLGWYFLRKRYLYWVAYIALINFIVLPGSYLVRSVLKDYQLMRLIVFIDPYIDPSGAGWNVIQSLTAIGSGGLTGKGYLQGTHSHQYLPEKSTDFIFSILSEELGFIGGILIFVLYITIIICGFIIVRRTNDNFGSYIATGLTTMFCCHFTMNIGMAIGLMPVIGIPLFLVSYGGSSIITAMLAIGLLISIMRMSRR